MSLTDLHTHTTYSDGKNTPEEMILSAIEKGMSKIGISDHSYTPFDEMYSIKSRKTQGYISEISFLKEKYRDKIEVLCGIEQDIMSKTSTEEFDYVIGSVHYIKCGEEYVSVDNTPQIVRDAVDKYFGGDIYAFAEEYYRLVTLWAQRDDIDIIGHFDLISKFNENGELFDEGNPRYIAAFKSAADCLLQKNIPFEINTGAISRGYRTTPYPSAPIMQYLKSKGASFILSSDAHSKENICFHFDRYDF